MLTSEGLCVLLMENVGKARRRWFGNVIWLNFITLGAVSGNDINLCIEFCSVPCLFLYRIKRNGV